MNRVISTQLKEYLDSLNCSQTDPLNLMCEVAFKLVGVHEEGRDNDGLLVSLFQKTIGGAFHEPWCLSFIQSIIAYVETTLSIKSELSATEHVLNLWNSSPKILRSTTPQKGHLILWKLKNTTSGHCGIITGINDTYFETIEGNTSTANSINRDGDGVYLKQRQKEGMGHYALLGVLCPFPPINHESDRHDPPQDQRAPLYQGDSAQLLDAS